MNMKLEKKHWIIGIVVVIILVWYFFLRNKKTESGFGRIVKRYMVKSKTAIIYKPVMSPPPLMGGGSPTLKYIDVEIGHKVSRGFNFTGPEAEVVPLNTTVIPPIGQLTTITTTPVLAVKFIYNGAIRYILAKDLQEILLKENFLIKTSESSWNPALGIKPIIPTIPDPGNPTPGGSVSPTNPLVQCAPCKSIDSCFPLALAKYKSDLASSNIKVVQSADWNFKGNLLRCLNCIG